MLFHVKIFSFLDYFLFRYYSYKEHREQQEEAAKYKKNPDEYRTKMEQMEAARMRLQQRFVNVSNIFFIRFKFDLKLQI